jgi:ADP-ribosylation factor protein 1
MGLSFSSLFNFMRKREVRIVMVGLDAAGKTTVLNKLKLGEVTSTIPTIGFNVDTVEYKNLKLTMWDVGGQHKLRHLWHYYYQGCDAVIFVVDSADKTRIAEAAQELHKVLESDELRNATLLVLANKQDMPNAMSTAEVQERLKLRDLRGGRKWFVQGCTAPTGHGLWEGLDYLSANLPPKSQAASSS